VHKAIKLPPTIVNLIAILKTKFGTANIQSSNLCIAPEQNMITNFGLNKQDLRSNSKEEEEERLEIIMAKLASF
jgi:hypothetical protein